MQAISFSGIGKEKSQLAESPKHKSPKYMTKNTRENIEQRIDKIYV